MRSLFPLFALIGTLSTPPVAGQSFEDAVRANTALAVATCLDVMIARSLPRDAFIRAGFTYRSIHRGVNEYNVDRGFSHYFDAPVETAKAEVNAPDSIAGICTVYTAHLTEPELNALVASTLAQRQPGTQSRGPGSWAIPTASGLPLIVGTRTITRHRYEPAGTVSVGMSYPG